jgi:hypothetical protein
MGRCSTGRSSVRAVEEVRGFTSVLDSNRVDADSRPTVRSPKLHHAVVFEKYIEHLRSEMVMSAIADDDFDGILPWSSLGSPLRHIHLL